jgi:hypothetical protein
VPAWVGCANGRCAVDRRASDQAAIVAVEQEYIPYVDDRDMF